MARLKKSKTAGSALILVLFAVVLLSTMGSGLLALGLNSRILAIRRVNSVKARCAADAGITRALFEMNQKLEAGAWSESGLPSGAEQSLPYCDATFTYTVTGSLAGGYTIESVGSSGAAVKTIYADLRLKGPFEDPISVSEDLTLKGNTTIDGFNSDDVSETVKTLIGTNSTESMSVELNNNSTIDGDVFVGVDGDIDTVIKDLGATYEDKFSLLEELTFPPVTAPTLPDMGTDIEAKGVTQIIGPTDSGMYEDIDLSSKAGESGILEIDGGDVVLHITGDIDIGQACELQIKPGSTLKMYLNGDLAADNSTGINNETNSAAAFKLYGVGDDQSFDLKNGTDFYGAIYAPNADIILYNSGQFYGSFSARNFEAKNNSDFHYDKALQDVSVTDDAVQFVVMRWREE